MKRRFSSSLGKITPLTLSYILPLRTSKQTAALLLAPGVSHLLPMNNVRNNMPAGSIRRSHEMYSKRLSVRSIHGNTIFQPGLTDLRYACLQLNIRSDLRIVPGWLAIPTSANKWAPESDCTILHRTWFIRCHGKWSQTLAFVVCSIILQWQWYHNSYTMEISPRKW